MTHGNKKGWVLLHRDSQEFTMTSTLALEVKGAGCIVRTARVVRSTAPGTVRPCESLVWVPDVSIDLLAAAFPKHQASLDQGTPVFAVKGGHGPIPDDTTEGQGD